MPLNIALSLLIFGKIFKKDKLIFLSIFILLFCSLEIVANSLWIYLESPWERINLNKINARSSIVVLSSSRFLPPGNTKVIEWHDPDRFFAGINLMKSGKAENLIFTGGFNPYKKGLPLEGNIYKKEAIQMGIPSNKILVTSPVKNTEEEAKAVKILLKKINLNNEKIILVTSAFHMKRAIKVFHNEGFDITPFPVDFKSNKKLLKEQIQNPLFWIPRVNFLNRTSSAIREIMGRIVYAFKK